eukprot:TRINITY_DN58297_c0_g1_i1.p2 TRINITY_DN58297_c0_g1~~TRINITY_DN58297_c0_g1_i1.p2  ORF type:complete len:100 (+),score=1.71 TRINITY_DN58297_c0_g1_i1:828-1127(+)
MTPSLLHPFMISFPSSAPFFGSVLRGGGVFIDISAQPPTGNSSVSVLYWILQPPHPHHFIRDGGEGACIPTKQLQPPFWVVDTICHHFKIHRGGTHSFS